MNLFIHLSSLLPAISCFAYPFGSSDQTSTDVVAYVGYGIAFDAWGMRSVVGTLDPYHILHKEIDGDFDLATFQAILTGGAHWPYVMTIEETNCRIMALCEVRGRFAPVMPETLLTILPLPSHDHVGIACTSSVRFIHVPFSTIARIACGG
jgi:hypothetical protein